MMTWTVVVVVLGLFSALVSSDLASLEKELDRYKTIMGALTRQMMMSQLYHEESMRATGDSGIKQRRVSVIGTRPWFTWDHGGNAALAIHDHSQNSRTQGLGEFVAVLNGVEFRTRHNDYKMQMPHMTSKGWQAVEFVPHPPVPPEVLAKKTVEAQIKEMRLWFKAFTEQKSGQRDYRKYFWPTLCYMEGFWSQSKETLDEPFDSDRHFIDATSWWDLTEKVRYTAFTGSKSNQENYAFLPMKIMNLINNDTEPVFAQWNYRILCAPIEDNIPLHKLRIIDDLPSRMAYGRTLEEHGQSRAARYEVFDWSLKNYDQEKTCQHCYLDMLMEQIPGLDNYRANLSDNSFGQSAAHYKTNEPLNTGYYHRRYKVAEAGAMGTKTRKRGFADRNVFMAQTTQERVPSLTVNDCKGNGANKVCDQYTSRWSYAIPLEIIWRTPLMNWNPYDIIYHGDNKKEPGWNEVTANGRNGGLSEAKAYDGTRHNIYYRTPAEFFGDGKTESDPADTSKGAVGVLDSEGNVRTVVASGTRIIFPEIPGAGMIRQRYPIAPLFNDGSQIYKEVTALKDIVMRMETYQNMLTEKPNFGIGEPGGPQQQHEFQMMITTQDPPGMHTHFVGIDAGELEEMKTTASSAIYETTENNGHSHALQIKYDAGAANGPWIITSCDGQKDRCWDGHLMYLEQLS